MAEAIDFMQSEDRKSPWEPEALEALQEMLYREEVEDARRLSIAQKLELGGDLFDAACQVTLSGIRGQNPGISEEEAMKELQRRLELGRRLESRL